MKNVYFFINKNVVHIIFIFGRYKFEVYMNTKMLVSKLMQYDNLSQSYVYIKCVVFQCCFYGSSISCHTVVGVAAAETAIVS